MARKQGDLAKAAQLQHAAQSTESVSGNLLKVLQNKLPSYIGGKGGRVSYIPPLVVVVFIVVIFIVIIFVVPICIQTIPVIIM